MAKRKFSDEIRAAILAAGKQGISRYRICQETGIKEAQMSRFMNGRGWLGQENLDALADFLNIHVSMEKAKE